MPKKGPRPSQRTTSAAPSLPTGAPVSPWMQAYGELRTAGWNQEQARRFATEEQKTGYLKGFLPTGVSQLPGVKAMTRAAPALLGKSETVSRMQAAQQMAQGAGVNLVGNIVGNVVGLGVGKLASKGLRKAIDKLTPALQRRVSGIDPTSEVVYHGRNEIRAMIKQLYSTPAYPFETPPHQMAFALKIHQERLQQALLGKKLSGLRQYHTSSYGVIPGSSGHPSLKGKTPSGDWVADILNPGSNATPAQKAKALKILQFYAEPTTAFHAGTPAAAVDTVMKDAVDDSIGTKYFRYEIPASTPRGPQMFDNVQAIDFNPRTQAWLSERGLIAQNLERITGRHNAAMATGTNLNEIPTPYRNVVEGVPFESIFEMVPNPSGGMMWQETLQRVKNYPNTSWVIPQKAVQTGSVIYRGSADKIEQFPDLLVGEIADRTKKAATKAIEGGLSQTGVIQNAALNSRRNRNKRR